MGQAVAEADSAVELYEPMNYHVGERAVSRYFEVPGSGGFALSDLEDLCDRLQHKRLRLRPGVFPSDRGWRRGVKRVTGSRATMSYRRYRLSDGDRDVVWKDPFAVFCLRELGQLLPGFSALVTFREAVAVAASFQRLSWGFDVVDLADRLGAVGQEVDPLPDLDYSDPLFNGVGTWLVVYGWLTRYAPDWTVFLHNSALSAHDVGALDRASTRLGLTRPLSQAVRAPEPASARGRRSTVPRSERAHPARRDATSVNDYWRELLDPATAERITFLTTPVWDRLVSRAAS